MTLELTRWTLHRDGPAFDTQRALILDSVAPTVWNESGESEYYVSRHGQNDVWLTLIAPASHGPHIRAVINAQLAPDLVESMVSRDDALLEDVAADYRRGLRLVSDVAIEMLLSPAYREHQVFLGLTMCRGVATVPVLESYCLAHSPRHRALESTLRARFWSHFFMAGHRSELSYYGHWLWNIVLGPQPQPGDDPWSLLQTIGAT